MNASRPLFARSLPVLAPIALLLLSACGEGGAKDPADGNKQAADVAGGRQPMCMSRDTTALSLAVLDYITSADPRPQRFLSAFGSDSALPDDGFKVLQEKGPTYYYNDNPKNQAQVKAKLEQAGPYPTMLVVYKGRQDADNGNTVTVSLGGHYVGGEHDGKVAPVRDVTVRCDSTQWRLPKPAARPAASAGGA